jgi:hypothetical protein
VVFVGVVQIGLGLTAMSFLSGRIGCSMGLVAFADLVAPVVTLLVVVAQPPPPVRN